MKPAARIEADALADICISNSYLIFLKITKEKYFDPLITREDYRKMFTQKQKCVKIMAFIAHFEQEIWSDWSLILVVWDFDLGKLELLV